MIQLRINWFNLPFYLRVNHYHDDLWVKSCCLPFQLVLRNEGGWLMAWTIWGDMWTVHKLRLLSNLHCFLTLKFEWWKILTTSLILCILTVCFDVNSGFQVSCV